MKSRELVIAGSLALILSCAWATSARAEAASARWPDVVGALRTSPGCLGVETAQTDSGKRVVFAWFENKKAIVAWYYSEAHQNAMRAVFPGLPSRPPLPDLADDSGPILAIASVTFVDRPAPDASGPPVSAISIELYSPLPGGVAVGGRFAPAALQLRGFRTFDIDAPSDRPR